MGFTKPACHCKLNSSCYIRFHGLSPWLWFRILSRISTSVSSTGISRSLPFPVSISTVRDSLSGLDHDILCQISSCTYRESRDALRNMSIKSKHFCHVTLPDLFTAVTFKRSWAIAMSLVKEAEEKVALLNYIRLRRVSRFIYDHVDCIADDSNLCLRSKIHCILRQPRYCYSWRESLGEWFA